MQQSPYWEANLFSVSHETFRILLSSKVYYPHSQVPATCPYPGPHRSSPSPTSHFLKIHLNIILPSMPGSSNWAVSLRLPNQNPIYTSALPIRATHPAHFILDLISRTILGEKYISLIYSLRSVRHSPLTSSLLRPNILLNTLFSYTLSTRASLNVSDQVSHPYKTTGKTIVVCILIFIFLKSKLNETGCCTEWQQAFSDFNLLLIYSSIEFWYAKVFAKYLKSSTLQRND